jgi:threonine synthase
MTRFACSSCHRPYPTQDHPYLCQHCGGVFSLEKEITYKEEDVDDSLPGIWRYRSSFGLSEGAPLLTLGEGRTPLVKAQALGREVHMKLEYLNPTGSYKDRGSALLLSSLQARNITQAVEDSSGNAGASFAAYAARADIRASVFVPGSASGPKRSQIEAYGAELIPVSGPRSAAAEAVRKMADKGATYASHAYLPFGLPGIATIAYELVEQLGYAPGTIIAPVGHGSLLLGIAIGFGALKRTGIISNSPQLIGVQAQACAPIWARAKLNNQPGAQIAEQKTLAEGVSVSQPVRGEELLPAVRNSEGSFLAIEEKDILPGRNALAKMGFYVEPTSAIVWAALEQLPANSPEPIVLLLTGSGLKSKAQ